MPENLNQDLSPEIPKKSEKPEEPEKIEKEELLELDENFSPKFISDKNKFIEKIRDNLEKQGRSSYKKEVEDIFINSEILGIAEEHGHEKAWELLKNEFLYNLKNDKEIDKKINLDRIIDTYNKSPLNIRAEKYKDDISKSFENSLKLSFLTEASKRLLEKYPDIDLISISDYLESAFSSFMKRNENELNTFFSNKKIKNENGKEIEINQDKIVLTNIDFNNFQINFESEKYQQINKENQNILQANKEVALIKFGRATKSLESFISDLPKPGFLSGQKKKLAVENFKTKTNELIKKLETGIEEIKKDKKQNPNYDYSNLFSNISVNLKQIIETNNSILDSKTKENGKKIIEEFNSLLNELVEDGRQNHSISSADYDNNQGGHNLKIKHRLGIPYNSDLKNKINNIKEFKDIFSAKILNKPFDREELDGTINKLKFVFQSILDEYSPEVLGKYKYFKKLRQEFSNFCDKNKVDAKKKEEMLSRFF